MARDRTEYEKMVDLAMLLSIWERTQECSPRPLQTAGDRLKLMKMAFLVGYDLYWQKIKALNTPFFRYLWGPYSIAVSDSWDALKELGLLKEEEEFVVTADGASLAKAFMSEVLALSQNEPIAAKIEQVVSEYGRFPGLELRDLVYTIHAHTIQQPNTERTIWDTPQNLDFTALLDERTCKAELALPASWETTLAIMLNKDETESIERSITDSRNGRIHAGWEALTADV